MIFEMQSRKLPDNKAYYRLTTTLKLPIKWMAIESMDEKVFSPSSDVRLLVTLETSSHSTPFSTVLVSGGHLLGDCSLWGCALQRGEEPRGAEASSGWASLGTPYERAGCLLSTDDVMLGA
jgi:hypothetical protein